ncbi:MAG: formylglycine-generating enzyme family protein [Proteobacteria bacterium]|nr:formylglycine-generating enzyme family protein [Pseudomonadota bacterium]
MAPAADFSDRVFSNSLGICFVLIPAGRFVMGSSPAERGRATDETPHPVTISRPFYLQSSEVTQGQYREITGINPARFSDGGDDRPVEKVSWPDTLAFIDLMNRRERTGGYRLPTEAEWEYACRAGSTTAYHWGDVADCGRANFGVSNWSRECEGSGPGRPSKPGTFPPNAWGLFDMHGNVWEWCQDWYGAYPDGPAVDPTGPPSGRRRVRRGGGWGYDATECRAARRGSSAPDFRNYGIGFRLARDM